RRSGGLGGVTTGESDRARRRRPQRRRLGGAVARWIQGRTTERSRAGVHRSSTFGRRDQDAGGRRAVGEFSETGGGVVGGFLPRAHRQCSSRMSVGARACGDGIMTFLNLWKVEVRRALHRRVVWVLIAVALAGIAILGVIAFATSSDLNAALTHAKGDHHPAIMADWWV